MNEKIKTSSNNFGGIGWYYILLTAVLFMLSAGLTTDTLNVTIDGFSQLHGWANTTLLHYSTLAGYISIAAAVLIGWLIAKKGTRAIVTGTLIVGGLATIWWGFVQSPIQYLIACAFAVSCNNGYAHLCSSNLAAVWFPTRKGLFLGWSTMGIQISAVILVPIMNTLLTHFGISYAYLFFGILQLVLAVVCWFTVRNTPEELDRTPDNLPMSQEEAAAYRKSTETAGNGMTILDVLKTKQTWLIAIPFGILYMTAVGVMSQLIPRLMSQGFDMPSAMFVMSVASLIGVGGSYLYGWIDVKFGVKKSSVIIMLDFIVAMFLMVLPFNLITMWISMVLVGAGLGGVANLSASFAASVFGPSGFATAFSVINPLMGIIRVTAMSVLAFGLTYFGGYSGAYAIFLGLCVVALILTVLSSDKPLEPKK